ncbi:MAG: permease [Planctomycetota bacterium]
MLQTSWNVTCQLAPWLLLGMLLSGFMHVLLPPGFIERRLRGKSGVIQAVLLGIPLPLCSCGVVPAGIGLKNQGASNGASVGFLISTPQTGVDSILVSASFLGWPFAIFKMFAAGVTGLIGGLVADQFSSNKNLANDSFDQVTPTHVALNPSNDQVTWINKIGIAWQHSIEIVRSIWGWLLVGILISAAIEFLVPQGGFESVQHWGTLTSMVTVLVVSIPLYVCATASVPIAASLVSAGFPPSAAMVFLLAGPATNVTTIGAILGRFGANVLAIYLLTIVLGSFIFAITFDRLLSATAIQHAGHDHGIPTWFGILSAILLIGFFFKFAVEDIQSWVKRMAGSKDANLELKIEGMTCQGCARKLEKAFAKFETVMSVDVNPSNGTAVLQGELSPEQISTAVTDAGFVLVETRKVLQNDPS